MIDNLLHRFGFSKLNYFVSKIVSRKRDFTNFHMNTRKPVVLLAPLDWGLGHTVRCIPIIGKLLSLDCEVIVACNTNQRRFLLGEFPDLQFVNLPGYDVKYGKTRLQTILKIFLQTPQILTAINSETRWLQAFRANHELDAIISDNRYGFASAEIRSIFITHQLQVKTGLGTWMDRAIQRILYRYINRFSACWIPDWEDKAVCAAGTLSHPSRFPTTHIRYMGCLSRLNSCAAASSVHDILIVLSGPEPQRSILEKILLAQLRSFKGSVVFVRGVVDDTQIKSGPGVEIINHAGTATLNRLMCSSAIIICRSGYTSIMDLLKIGRKAILVPTPGQTEQEYLAMYMHERKMAIMARQNNFDLQLCIDHASNLPAMATQESMDQYACVVEELVASLKAGPQSLSADLGKSKK